MNGPLELAGPTSGDRPGTSGQRTGAESAGGAQAVVPISSLEVRPQVRTKIDPTAIAAMAASIESVGLQQPVLCVRGAEGTLRVLDGHQRRLALRQLGRSHVPVLILEGPLDPEGVIARQLIANVQRVNLDPVDRALGIRQMMELSGLPAAGVAALLGLSPASVSRSLRLTDLPASLRERVQRGEVSADAAYLLARMKDHSSQSSLIEQVARGSLTRDQLARSIKLVKHTARRGRGKPSASATRSQRTARPKLQRAHFRWDGIDFDIRGAVLSAATLVPAIEALALWARQYVGDPDAAAGPDPPPFHRKGADAQEV